MGASIKTNVSGLFHVFDLCFQECFRGIFVDKNLHLWTQSGNGRYRRLANQLSLPSGIYPFGLSELKKKLSESRAFIDFQDQEAEHSTETTSLKGKFVIAIVLDGLPLFPTRNPEVFDTREEAEHKLVRCQQMNPDTRFCLFECKGELKSVGVVLE